ncbi:MAG: hypothetical protein R3E63_03195 [Pseudomonadales bacterium]
MLFRIAADHPSLAGHFPSNPVVPGVVLLDHILATAKTILPTHRVCGIRKLKWLQPVLPEQQCEVQWAVVHESQMRESQVRFVCLCEGKRAVEGNLVLDAA